MNIIIIGAGVAGLSIGWRLLQAGAQVTILERGQAANGATWAAAGMIAPESEMGEAPVEEIDFSRKSSELWPSFAAEIEEASGLDVGFSRSGALLLGNDAASMTAKAAANPALSFMAPDAVRARWPMLTGECMGALWAPGEAHVDNRALGQALTAAFLRAGGTLKPVEAAVKILEVTGGRAGGVATPFTRYPADAILLAAGAWSAQVVEEVPVSPVKGEMIALMPPQDTVFDFSGPVVWGPGVYLVPRHDRLLAGATVEERGFDTSLSDETAWQLHKRAAAVMPALAGWHLVEHWAGLRPASPDRLPLLGPLEMPGLFVASGQYRNGILFAPAIARLMADMLLGKAEPIAAFDPRRFTKGKAA